MFLPFHPRIAVPVSIGICLAAGLFDLSFTFRSPTSRRNPLDTRPGKLHDTSEGPIFFSCGKRPRHNDAENQPLIRINESCAQIPILVGVLFGLFVAVFQSAQPAFANADGKWNYNLKGDDWGKVYKECNGRNQTPIDIRVANFASKGDDFLWPWLRYRPTDSEVYNAGLKTVQANGSFGQFTLPDGIYEAKQFHFHFPSEHTVNGRVFSGEMHIVHQRTGSEGTNDLAVIGILLDEQGEVVYGKEGVLLSRLGFGTELPSPDGKIPVNGLDLNAFANEFKGGFYHYKGSLSTPPCSETVHWYVLKRPVKITSGMATTFRQAFPEDNRRVQLLNKRRVTDSDLALPGEFLANWDFSRV